jgi:serine/threonine-protein kinase HipA
VLGRLIYVKEGAREFSQFTYIEKWASDPEFFDISPDLTQQLGYQLRKPKTLNTFQGKTHLWLVSDPSALFLI